MARGDADLTMSGGGALPLSYGKATMTRLCWGAILSSTETGVQGCCRDQ